MLTYQGDPELKKTLIGRMRQHVRLDQLQPAWGYGKMDPEEEKWRGCFLGCVICPPLGKRVYGEEATAHGLHNIGVYVRQEVCQTLGIPMAWAYAADRVFENIAEAMEWPVLFLETLPVGVELPEEVEGVEIQNQYVNGRLVNQNISIPAPLGEYKVKEWMLQTMRALA